jgi:molybdopterin converting factor small subunit
MSNIAINIELFGFLQDCSKQKIVTLNLPSGISIGDIKQELLSSFNDAKNDQRLQDLPNNCVLSDDKEILFDEAQIFENANLAILPPVCGG